MIDINPPRRLQFSLRCRSTRCSCWASLNLTWGSPNCSADLDTAA